MVPSFRISQPYQPKDGREAGRGSVTSIIGLARAPKPLLAHKIRLLHQVLGTSEKIDSLWPCGLDLTLYEWIRPASPTALCG